MHSNYLTGNLLIGWLFQLICVFGPHHPIKNPAPVMHYAVVNDQGALVITPSPTSNARDFDFLLGTHRVFHRKLTERLAGAQHWQEFEGTHGMQALLGGQANLEQHEMLDPTGEPLQGIALRLFDPQTHLWSIHWSDSRRLRLDVPVTGSFQGGVGYFYAQDLFEGRPILVEFTWDARDPGRPVWSQAFSADQGRTWETNWYMHFVRQPEPTPTLDTEAHIGVIELRNYRIKAGMRDSFITYFETHFLQSQLELQGFVLGRYRVEGRENNFCWIRGFESMNSRSAFLPAFYFGAFWKQHKRIANELLANNDEVYLLRPMRREKDSLVTAPSVSPQRLRPRRGITVVEFFVANNKLPHLLRLFGQSCLPVREKSGFQDYTVWTSEMQANDFPQLPVFQNKDLLVVISHFPDEAAYRRALQRAQEGLSAALRIELEDTITVMDTWILHPTEKSLQRP
jgi:hypothetical protein